MSTRNILKTVQIKKLMLPITMKLNLNNKNEISERDQQDIH